jgi:hypothetical protein
MTPEIQLRTMLVLDARGRIVASQEPNARPGPRFILIRSKSECAWAMAADIAQNIAIEVERLAREEPPLRDFKDAPVHAVRYAAIFGGQIYAGPAFTFPEEIPHLGEVTTISELRLLERHFHGWTAEEIPERSPIMAVMHDGYPVSVCFCARKTDEAAEAGLETAAEFRGQGFAPRVTAAWARAIKESGRVPLYSTSWTNTASLAVARKLVLVQYASDWSVPGAS